LLPELGPTAVDARVEAHLIGALSDDDGEAATQAALALGELGGRASLAPLFRALERDEASAHAAATALGRLGSRHYDEVRILLSSRGLGGSDAPHLCRVLGACGRQADAPALKAALGAESPAIRRAAAEALAHLPLASGSEVVDALLFALADESAKVRAAAAHALGAHVQAPFGPALDALERAAHDLEVAVRAQAARALGALARRAILDEKTAGAGAARARPLAVLRRLADAPEPVAAVPALEALGALGDPADDARLLTALESPDAEIVKAAARALGARHGALSASEARAALERALTDRRWDVRRAAALALGAHGPVAHPLLYARRTVESDPLVLESIDLALGIAIGHSLGSALDGGSEGGRPRGARG
ncbi:MAG TPA: HEAT repeat domain-containing protein, partial [Polyangia bacterium]